MVAFEKQKIESFHSRFFSVHLRYSQRKDVFLLFVNFTNKKQKNQTSEWFAVVTCQLSLQVFATTIVTLKSFC